MRIRRVMANPFSDFGEARNFITFDFCNRIQLDKFGAFEHNGRTTELPVVNPAFINLT
jgi:hypothetical protein